MKVEGRLETAARLREVPAGEDWPDKLLTRYDRHLQLLRGWLLRLRGATAGERFGVGPRVQVRYPNCLSVGDDVTFVGFTSIRSTRPDTVRIGSNTAFPVGFWLDCGGRDNPGLVEIGRYCQFGPYVLMNAGGSSILIGDHVGISHLVTIHAGQHVFDDPAQPIFEQGTTHKGVTIEDDCWIGTKSTILDGVIIGRGSVIGAGAVVTESLPPLSIAVGAPARLIKKRGE